MALASGIFHPPLTGYMIEGRLRILEPTALFKEDGDNHISITGFCEDLIRGCMQTVS